MSPSLCYSVHSIFILSQRRSTSSDELFNSLLRILYPSPYSVCFYFFLLSVSNVSSLLNFYIKNALILSEFSPFIFISAIVSKPPCSIPDPSLAKLIFLGVSRSILYTPLFWFPKAAVTNVTHYYNWIG